MTLLTLDLEPELYEHLRREAALRGATVEIAAQSLLMEGLNVMDDSSKGENEQDRVTAVLKAAGLLTTLSPEENQRAEKVDVTLEEVINALDASEGPPLSELIIEMRGPKD